MYQCYPSLAGFIDVDRCWDFDSFLREMKTPGLPDVRVTQLMMVELVYRDNKVFIRTKPRMVKDSKVPWSGEKQFHPDPNQHHPRPRNDQQPPRTSHRKVKD